jgi:nucleolar protein 16
VHTLNPLASGGAEHDPTKASVSSTTFASESSHSHSSQAGPSAPPLSLAPIPKGYGKIIRDSDGNVVRVELGADDEKYADQPADEGEMQGLQEPEVDKQVMANWVTELGGGRGSGAAIVQCESSSFSLCTALLFFLICLVFERS